MTTKLPGREHTHTIKLDADTYPKYDKKAFSHKATLMELSQTYVFFTHAALFTYGNWARDPINDYIAEEDPYCFPFWMSFDKPIFSGLFCRDKNTKRTYREWNYRLIGCPKNSWPDLQKFLHSLSGINHDEGRFHITIMQKLPMIDYMMLNWRSSLPHPLPMFDIYTLGLLGNDRSVFFEPAKNPPLDHIKVTICPPQADVIELSTQVLSGDTSVLGNVVSVPMEEPNEHTTVD